MLVLARSVGQSVVLDDRVTVTVVEARGGLVRLGIVAPGDVVVRRGELEPHGLAGSCEPAHPRGSAAPDGSVERTRSVEADDSRLARRTGVSAAPGR